MKMLTTLMILMFSLSTVISFSQDVRPVIIEKQEIIYQIGTSEKYIRTLPVALPTNVVLRRLQFDLFPALSDPEIKAELVKSLNDFTFETASTQQKDFFLQNLTHLVFLDINNVELWDKTYAYELHSISMERRFEQKSELVSKLIDDYIKLYLPAIESH